MLHQKSSNASAMVQRLTAGVSELLCIFFWVAILHFTSKVSANCIEKSGKDVSISIHYAGGGFLRVPKI